MTRRVLTGLAVVALVVGGGIGHRGLGHAATAQGAKQTGGVPKFQVDPSWPRLPNQWVMGVVSSVAVDRKDNVWILHRPRTVPADRKDHAAPPVLEFDTNGKFVQAWGGPADTYDWPYSEHGIAVDYRDKVWIGGSNPIAGSGSNSSDDMLLTFTNKGKFLLQLGHPDKSGGNKDTINFKRPADVYVYPKTNEAFVADGYGNRRVIVLDAATGGFKRMWGAFGNEPLDPPPPPARGTPPAGGGAGAPPPPRATEGPGPQQFGTVHGIKVSNDGLVYVADRNNQRIQIFSTDGKYLNQVFINRTGASPMTVAGLAFSPDKQQQFIYAADYGNSHIFVVNRKTLEVLDSFGNRSSNPGDFQGIHNIASDSKGNLYTAEVVPGNRAQKFVFKGLSPAAPQ